MQSGFYREALNDLERWQNSENRKPLVIRGMRQVGKSTLVDLYAQSFSRYIKLNLEIPEDRNPFTNFKSIESLLDEIGYLKKTSLKYTNEPTLIFIDEIQEEAKAFSAIRYLYEERPDLFVITAGSLLESLFDVQENFPVGRVDYLFLHPVTFPEFLLAINKPELVEIINSNRIPEFVLDDVFYWYNKYIIIGGMPSAVKSFVQHKNLVELQRIYKQLNQSYLDDIPKYANSESTNKQLSHILSSIYSEAGNRITFHGFGKSNYRSREMSEGLRTLERAFLLKLIYPITSTQLPFLPDKRKSPRLLPPDTGLLCNALNLQQELILKKDLQDAYRGKLIELATAQALFSASREAGHSIHFWVRDAKGSDAEVDFVIPIGSQLIPVEVKSGTGGSLKSLQLFMGEVEHNRAIRLYHGPIRIDKVQTFHKDRSFNLLNLPYFLAFRLHVIAEQWLHTKDQDSYFLH